MKTGKLLTLLVVAILAVVAALFAYRRDTAIQPGASSAAESWRGAKLLPQLVEKAGDIRRIEIDKALVKIVLVRGDKNEWTVESSGGYPAMPGRVKDLVLGLSGLVASDRLTESTAKYKELGVEGKMGQEGAIRLMGASNQEIASILLGKTRELKLEPGQPMPRAWGGQFVRVGSDPFVYLANDRVYTDTALISWVKTEVAELKADDVMSVDLEHATTESARLGWDDGKLKLEGPVPKDMQPKESKIQSVRAGLDFANFTNVLRADTQEAKAIDFATTTTFHALNGSILTVRSGAREDTATTTKTLESEDADAKTKYYVAVTASYGEPFFTDDDTATTQSLATAQENAKKAKEAVPEFNKSHAPWIFEIRKWNYDNIAPTRSELIEPKPTPTPTPTPPPTNKK